MTREQYNKHSEIIEQCIDRYTFEFEGLLIDGYRVEIVKRYVLSNTGIEFRAWLIDMGLVLKEL